MKKRVIRLTESDLMRLVKRVIKEQEWSDEDESEFSSIEKEYNDEIKKIPTYNKSWEDYDDDSEKFMSDFDKIDWKSLDPIRHKYKEKSRMRRDFRRKECMSKYESCIEKGSESMCLKQFEVCLRS
jgi:hypothetical protein